MNTAAMNEAQTAAMNTAAMNTALISTPSPTAVSTAQTDRELLRLHRRACSDFAARMRLPAWEHMAMPLSQPLEPRTVADLLARAADGNLAASARMSGQPPPAPVEILRPALGAHWEFGGRTADRPDPTHLVIESVRTVLAVCAGLDAGAGFSLGLRELLWTRVVELTVLGYDLQQAIGAGAGLDELLVDAVLAAAPQTPVWPNLEPLPVDLSTPPLQRLLASAGRPAGRWVCSADSAQSADPGCSTGQC